MIGHEPVQDVPVPGSKQPRISFAPMTVGTKILPPIAAVAGTGSVSVTKLPAPTATAKGCEPQAAKLTRLKHNSVLAVLPDPPLAGEPLT